VTKILTELPSTFRFAGFGKRAFISFLIDRKVSREDTGFILMHAQLTGLPGWKFGAMIEYEYQFFKSIVKA
jgi:hypothetical protein